MSTQLSVVPFQGDNILLAEYNGEPYVPAKPIVENMGLDWKGQHAKIRSNERRWGMVIISIPSGGGMQEMSCIPLRKLPAFFYSIDARKVKAEIRPKVEKYQDECDDALWAYWNEGHAVNPRKEAAILEMNAKYIALLERHVALLEKKAVYKRRVSQEEKARIMELHNK